MATGCTVWRAVSRLESGKWLPRTHGQACCGKEKVKLMRRHTGLEKHHNAQALIMDSTGSGNTSHRSFRARKCLLVLVVPILLTRARVAFSDLHVLSPGQRHLRWPTSQVSAQVIFTDQRFPSKTFLEIVRSKSRSHPWGSMEGATLFHHVQHL